MKKFIFAIILCFFSIGIAVFGGAILFGCSNKSQIKDGGNENIETPDDGYITKQETQRLTVQIVYWTSNSNKSTPSTSAEFTVGWRTSTGGHSNFPSLTYTKSNGTTGSSKGSPISKLKYLHFDFSAWIQSDRWASIEIDTGSTPSGYEYYAAALDDETGHSGTYSSTVAVYGNGNLTNSSDDARLRCGGELIADVYVVFRKVYYANYYGNGNEKFPVSGIPSRKRTLAGIAYTLDSAPSRSGYVFNGWHLNSTSGTTYSAGEEIGADSVSGNHYWYAGWDPHTYKININILSPSGSEDGASGTANFEYYDIHTKEKEAFYDCNNEGRQTLTTGSTITISNIRPALGMYLYNVSADKGLYSNSVFTASGLGVPSGGYDATITIQMKWKTATIDYNSNGGTPITKKDTVTYLSKYPTLPSTTRVGYSFEGWYYGGNKITTSTTVRTIGNHTLVASWTPNIYPVTLSNERNLLKGDMGFEDVYEDYNVGWNNTNNGVLQSVYWGTFNGGVGNVTQGYHAHIKDFGDQRHRNVLEYRNESPSLGRWIGSSQWLSTDTFVAGRQYAIMFDVYRVRGGNHFWGGIYHTLTNNSSWEFHSGMFSFYPQKTNQWETFCYKFTMHPNYNRDSGASIYMYGHDQNPGSFYVDNVCMYEVDNGFLTSSATGRESGNIYLKYDNGFYSNDTASSNITKVTPPTKIGYTFKGYYSQNGSLIVNSSGNLQSDYNFVSNVGFINARWNPNNYTLYFNSHGGSSVPSTTITYDATYGSLPTPTRDGCVFVGWYLESSLKTKITASSYVRISKNHTLYAKWNIGSGNLLKYDSSKKYYYFEDGYFPQTRVTISGLNTSLPVSRTMSIGGKSRNIYSYSGSEYAYVEGKWFRVDPIRWRISDYGVTTLPSNLNYYGAKKTNFLAVSDKVINVDYMNELNTTEGWRIGDSNLFKNVQSTDFKLRQVSTNTVSMDKFNTNKAEKVAKYDQSNVKVRIVSEEELDLNFKDKRAEASDLVKHLLKISTNNCNYWTRDLTNLNNAKVITITGTTKSYFMNNLYGVRYSVKFTNGHNLFE